MRQDLNDWCESNGYKEPEGLREIIRRTTQEQQTLKDIRANEKIMERLDCIEQEIKNMDRSLWTRLFR